MERVLITGGTGFVGRQLVAALSKHSVRLALKSAPDRHLDSDAVVVGDINDRTDWSHALKGMTSVVHLAAHVHVMNATAADQRRFEIVNVQGTRRLAEAAVAHGINRFVFLSSIKVNGESTDGVPMSAGQEPHPVDYYGISKWRAEQVLFQIAAQSQMAAVAIRSPLVYGPGVKANFLRLMSWVANGVPLPLGAVDNKRSLVSVWNLCDLIRTTLESPSIPSGPVMVSDGEDLSTAELIKRLAAALDRPTKLIPVPVFAIRVLGTFLGKSNEVSRLVGSLSVDIEDTRRKFAWSPPLSVDESLRRTAIWYRKTVSTK